MGFSALQGKISHEALLSRQDAEIRLIETMKRCLSQKAKCDKEYSMAINNLTQQGLKVDRGDDFLGSQIFQAWRSFMEEMEQQAKQVRFNSEQLDNLCSDRITQLYQEKRKSRKQFQEEHNKIASQFAHLTEDVARKKSEYQKHLEYYKILRTRFEEHYIKSGRAGRKLDDVRDKYQKACRKLHLAHNEYVLLINEAIEVEKDVRTILLPNLLSSQQQQQENFISTWKSLLIEASSLGDFTSDKYIEIQRRIDASFQNVNPADEYREFTDKHKTSPALPVIFRFDDQLIEDTVGKLQPNQLTVDNLTVDWLRQRLNDLENSVKECQEKQTKLPAETNGKLSTPSSPLSSSPATNSFNLSGNNSTSNSMNGSSNSLKDIKHTKDLHSLKCQERQMQKLIDLIRTALNEVSCEELPSGCDDLSVDMDNSSPEQTNNSSHPVSMLIQKGGDFMTLIRNPFKKRSTVHGDGTLRSPSGTPKSVRGTSMARSSSVASSMTIATNRPLYEEEWFHGVLPREEVVRLLRNEGDFLVRETTRNDESQTVLSVCWSGHKHFIVQTTAEGHYRFEGPSFPSIQELILHQYQSESPVTSRSGSILKKPVLRERWELSNDDVILLDKIGRGNFGDVYKAKLKSSKKDVAVKTCRMTLPDEQKRKFLQEGRILKQYDHPNIVKLIGICVQKQPIMIVMELVEGGSLLMFLRKNAAGLEQRSMMAMCRDTAAGMRYLESKNCIHRDLAARNCLIGNENIVKISDFGMSREEEEYIVSDGMKQIPIKWTAPEALNFGKYTTLCDVWSYGILIWEIFSKGGTPYAGMSNSKARERIDEGYRMSTPDNTPSEMYRLMLKCWSYESENRPHFDEIFTVVDLLLSKKMSNNNMSNDLSPIRE
ncbi:unnamed protein product [Diamesa tonsa]